MWSKTWSNILLCYIPLLAGWGNTYMIMTELHLYVARDHLVEQSTKLGVTLGKVE